MQKMTLFIFWIILICTFCSQKIETLMKIQVVIDEYTAEVLYTSRHIDGHVKEENLVEVKLRPGQEEAYLIVTEDGEKETVFAKAKYPFMEEQVKEQLGLEKSTRVFRVLDIEQFRSMIPRIIGLGILLVVQLALWIAFGVCGQKPSNNRNVVDWKQWVRSHKWCLVMVAAIIVLTWVFASVVASIDLPSSLLPTENIFDWKHYLSEFVYF